MSEEVQVTKTPEYSNTLRKRIFFWLGFLLICLLIFLVGYTVRDLGLLELPASRQSFASRLFSERYTTIRGTIIKVNQNLVTIQNMDDLQGTFRLAEKYSINKNTQPVKSYQNDKSQIELNKPAYILMLYISHAYRIVSITY